jgi:asparagine synthase (glutamine-hydrolysing)
VALLILLHDPNPERADRALRAAAAEALPVTTSLAQHTLTSGPWRLHLRLPCHTPFALDPAPAHWTLRIGRLLDRDLKPQPNRPPWRHPVGGYGLALDLDLASGHLTAATDHLGIFPLYTVSGSDWWMLTTTPWFARCHPAFTPAWDLEGLAGQLMTMHEVHGHTVWRGVHRVGTGTEISGQPANGFHEHACTELRFPAEDPGLPDHSALDRIAASLDAGRNPAAQPVVSLSGGLDSRLLAAIVRQRTPRPRAATYGQNRDVEMRCARLVADRLDMPHDRLEPATASEHAAFCTTARLELGANGLNTADAWAIGSLLPPGADFITGYSLDLFFNTPSFYTERGLASREDVARFFGRWGLSQDACVALCPDPAFRAAIASVETRILDWIGKQSHPTVAHAAQLYEACQRTRHHVGGMAWRLGWSVNPLMPGYDPGLIERLWSFPAARRHGRALEKNLLIHHFPALARLPLDRNNLDVSPLLPRTRWHDLRDRLAGRPSARLAAPADRSSLRYFRAMDINAPAWRALRHELEPLRAGLHDVFDPAALARILPEPDAPIAMNIPIAESSTRKTLLGLMVIARAMRSPFPGAMNVDS